ncbi:MAG: DUF2892 domain-containing protein [Verrucomicrobiaceae bacterium]|nr:DUF2892 domain-containing protein [Verrucomicrobiaceae bacterium]
MKLTRNIETPGRIIRLVIGLACLAVAWRLWPNRVPTTLAAVGGVFCIFQALSGWCLARACGIKTRF